MNFDVSAEQAMALDSMRRFLEKEIRPLAVMYRDGPTPKAVMQRALAQIVAYGVGHLWMSGEYDGVSIDLMTHGLLFEEVARVWPELAGTALINSGVATILHALGSAEQKRGYLDPLLRGERIASAAITEPQVGSNVADVTTRAVRDGDQWRVSGEKTWISNGDWSDFALVVARTGGEGVKGLSMLLVEREHGYESRDIPKMAMNGWSTASLFFDDVRVPAANLVGEPGVGLKQTLVLFERARVFVALMSTGIAQAALDDAIAYAKVRHQHGKPIGGHQLIQAMIAEMATELDCSRLLCYRALYLLDKGGRCDTQTSMAKWYATEVAVSIASKAVQIHGGYGLSREYPAEQHFRNARMMTIPDGTTEIQKLIIARNLLGLNAFS